MDVGPPLVPRSQPSKLLQPRHRPLDHPPQLAQTGRARLAASGQERVDAAAVQFFHAGDGVIGLVGRHEDRPRAGPAPAAADRWELVDQRQQDEPVGDVRRRDVAGQRRALGVGQQVLLAAAFAAVRRVRAGRFAPFTARRLVLSAMPTRGSSRPLAFS